MGPVSAPSSNRPTNWKRASIVLSCSIYLGVIKDQWPFQEPTLEVPTICKAYFSGLCKGISPENMAKNMVLTYLPFRILKLPFIFGVYQKYHLYPPGYWGQSMDSQPLEWIRWGPHIEVYIYLVKSPLDPIKPHLIPWNLIPTLIKSHWNPIKIPLHNIPSKSH